ncbi:MAG: hypothetical protein FD123_121 [Bacteroidetes bacterium]|nr:MAG: hypothetical protein FD123_121 [Bacteroidota bacterium]
MKTRITTAIVTALVLLFISSPELKAQSNLLFSRAIIYNIPGDSLQNFTVPAGKVWKIESSGSSEPGSSGAIIIKDALNRKMSYLTGASTATGNAVYPIWLPAAFSGSFVTINQRGFISIIEYTVTP